MKIIICNAFSLSMLDRETQSRTPGHVLGGARYPAPIEDPLAYLRQGEDLGIEIESAVGHADTARIFEGILDRPIPANRVSIRLDTDTLALIGQYVGPRLPEGATQLPEGSRIEWWIV